MIFGREMETIVGQHLPHNYSLAENRGGSFCPLYKMPYFTSSLGMHPLESYKALALLYRLLHRCYLHYNDRLV